MSDPETDQDVVSSFRNLTTAVNALAAVIGPGFPLDKRETFAALIIMGLSSRLQPLHVDSLGHQNKVVKLSFALADAALRECTPKEE